MAAPRAALDKRRGQAGGARAEIRQAIGLIRVPGAALLTCGPASVEEDERTSAQVRLDLSPRKHLVPRQNQAGGPGRGDVEEGMAGVVDQIIGAAGQLAQHCSTGRAPAHQDARRSRARRGLEQAHQLLDFPIRIRQIAGRVADDQRSELPARLHGIPARRPREEEPPGHGVLEGQVILAIVRQLPGQLRVAGIDRQR